MGIIKRLSTLLEAQPNLHIKWTAPDVNDEIGEYFENVRTKKFFKSNGISFKTDGELLKFLNSGKLVLISKEELLKDADNLTLTDKDFKHELQDKEYKKSFESMEQKLTDTGSITLPAPIILKTDTTYYGFAGNRRMNLAFRYNIPLKVWLVKL